VVSRLQPCRALHSTPVRLRRKSDRGKDPSLKAFDRMAEVVTSPAVNPALHRSLLAAPVPSPAHSKLLRVAILGVTNAGKSTLVNRLLGRQVCPASCKPNTTRTNARAVLTDKDTQVVFLDTPGLVDQEDASKFNLERSLLLDPEEACRSADLLLVLQDVSNRYTREAINTKVLRLLCLYYYKVPSIIVINKIDTIPKSRRVFDLIRKLTCNRLKGVEGQVTISKQDSKWSAKSYLKRKARSHEEDAEVTERSDVLERAAAGGLTEGEVASLTAGLLGWPGFTDVFTISALQGDGVEELREYLLQEARPANWQFAPQLQFDGDPRELVVNLIKSKFLDNLPKSIPYELEPEIQIWEWNEEWKSLNIVATVKAKNKWQFRMLLGQGANTIKRISEQTQEALSSLFSHEVHFKLTVIPTFTEKVVDEVAKQTIKPSFLL